MDSFFSSGSLPVDASPLEEALAESITEKDIQELGLPRYCLPRVIGSLPLKEGFTYLPALKRQYIDKALLHLYDGYHPQAKIVLFTWVIGDGLGDYFAQQETAKILQESLPEVEISLITLVHKEAKIPKTDSTFSEYVIPYEVDFSNGWNAVKYVPFSEEILKELRSASLVIQIPTYFPHTQQLLEQISFKGGPRYELVGEGGWLDTPHFHPLTGARCMGLHFLEKGIFIKKVPQGDFLALLDKISDPRIRSALLTKEKENFFSHRFNLAYTRYDVGFYLYLHALLKSLEKDTKDIDVCFFDMKSFVQNTDGWYKPLFLKYGIKNVVLFHKENIVEIPVSSKGKTLKLIHIENVKHDDYVLLLSMSQDLVGCRGDGSIFEAISADKVFFLDIAAHQRKFLKDLIALAQFHLPQCPEVAEYFACFLSFPTLAHSSAEERVTAPNLSLEELGEKMGALLQSTQVIEGIKLLNRKIREEHSVNTVLVNMTKRALYFQEHPAHEILEQHALNGFLYGEKPAKEVLIEIQDEVRLRPGLAFKNI